MMLSLSTDAIERGTLMQVNQPSPCEHARKQYVHRAEGAWPAVHQGNVMWESPSPRCGGDAKCLHCTLCWGTMAGRQ